jgi:hypothetical protein
MISTNVPMRVVCLMIFVLGIIGCLSSCANVPPEAVQLSGELTTMIRTAEASHLALLDSYITERKKRVDDFLEKTWIPKFLETGAKDAKISDLVAAEPDKIKKEELLNEFNSDAAVQINHRRASLMNAVDEIGNSLREAITLRYADILTVNQALTSHLQSGAKITEARKELFDKLKIDPAKLFPLDKINSILDRTLDYKNKAEDILNLLGEAKTLLKEK